MELEKHLGEGAELERSSLAVVATLTAKTDLDRFQEIMQQAWEAEDRLLKTTVMRSRANAGGWRGSLRFRRYWQKQTEKLGL